MIFNVLLAALIFATGIALTVRGLAYVAAYCDFTDPALQEWMHGDKSVVELMPTKFEPRPVPLDVAQVLGVERSWRPVDGRPFRVLYSRRNGVAVFPSWTRLRSSDRAGISELVEEAEGYLL